MNSPTPTPDPKTDCGAIPWPFQASPLRQAVAQTAADLGGYGFSDDDADHFIGAVIEETLTQIGDLLLRSPDSFSGVAELLVEHSTWLQPIKRRQDDRFAYEGTDGLKQLLTDKETLLREVERMIHQVTSMQRNAVDLVVEHVTAASERRKELRRVQANLTAAQSRIDDLFEELTRRQVACPESSDGNHYKELPQGICVHCGFDMQAQRPAETPDPDTDQSAEGDGILASLINGFTLLRDVHQRFVRNGTRRDDSWDGPTRHGRDDR